MMLMMESCNRRKSSEKLKQLQKSTESNRNAFGKSSNSSSETVIARICPNAENTEENNNNNNNKQAANDDEGGEEGELIVARMEKASANEPHEPSVDFKEVNHKEESGKRIGRFKSFLHLTAQLNPFGHHNNQDQQQQQQKQRPINEEPAFKSSKAHHHHHHLALMEMAQRYFARQWANFSQQQQQQQHDVSKSAPVTPIKGQPQEGATCAESFIKSNGFKRLSVDESKGARPENNLDPLEAESEISGEPTATDKKRSEQWRPSVRFEETRAVERKSKRTGSAHFHRQAKRSQDEQQQVRTIQFVDCAVQTSDELDGKIRPNEEEGDGEEEEGEGVKSHEGRQIIERKVADDEDLVKRLFQLPRNEQELVGETPMDSESFRKHGYKLIDYIANYLDTIAQRRVTPLNIEPGYLKTLIQASAPNKGESFSNIMHDFENHIMCGITHWQHPHFHAYFPAGNAYPSILADVLSDALGCVGFSWAASPAYTELEIIMLDWMGQMIGLPDEFLCLSGNESKGGGVIQGSASECVLVSLLAARHWAMERLRKRYPQTPDGVLLSKLIGYCSREAHSCVEKAAMIGFIRMRALETDERHSLRGETLARALEADIEAGLEPFLVCATLGTTSCVSFDNLEELGSVCKGRDIWLHVDAAYAGSALICPEFKYLMRGIEMANSFNMNPNKWMLINFDCSLMWVKDRFKLTRAFVVDPLYLQHSFSDQAIDYRHWGIPLSRRFRALKLWFVIRNYGVEGLQAYIRNHVKLAKLFEQCIRQDPRFSITNEVVLGLVCFRLIGSNALNQRLLSMINASGKLHMVPASLNGRYVIRFCVCDQRAQETDIRYAYKCISEFASELFDSIKAGRERIRAISQQNTIDVSSLSLHTQRSISADQTPPNAAGENLNIITTSATPTTRESQTTPSTVPASPPACGQQRNLLAKQVSTHTIQSAPATDHTTPAEDEDLEQEIVLDSMATADGLDYELEDYEDENDDLLEPALLADNPPPGSGSDGHEQQNLSKAAREELASSEWPSPVARRWHSRASRRSQTQAAEPTGAGGELEEAADELFTLAERRNRMSLRYKREFFVRVVSDPRVYRASISGDINAHASSGSLGPQAPPIGPAHRTSKGPECAGQATVSNSNSNNNSNNTEEQSSCSYHK